MAVFAYLSDGVWGGLDRHIVDIRGHPVEVSDWLRAPDLPGLYAWSVRVVRSQYGEGGQRFLVISDPHTAMACKLRWG